MRKSRFTDSEIIAVLKRGEGGDAVPELCREVGISTATFYKWRATYGGADDPIGDTQASLDGRSAQIEARIPVDAPPSCFK